MKDKKWLVLAGGFLVLLAAFVGGTVPFFLLYAFGLTLLIPLGHCLLGKLFLRGSITIPEAELMADEEITVRIRVDNPLHIPFPCIELENELGTRITGIREEQKVFSLEARDWLEEQSVLRCQRRGFYKVGQIRLIIRDVLNIAALKKTITTPISLKIYPKVKPIDFFPVLTSRQKGHLRVKDPLFQDAAELSDLRQYQEGDPIKRIHWKVSLRKDEIMVKHFEERGDTEVLILIDSSRDHYGNDPEGWTEDQLVEAAVSVIDYCLKRSIHVSLRYQSLEGEVFLQGDSSACLKLFLDGMALFRPVDKKAFESRIEQWTRRIQQGTALMILTPNLTKELAARSVQLRRKNVYPVLMAFGDAHQQPQSWHQFGDIGKKATQEGIPFYLFHKGKQVKEVLEGTHGSGNR